MTPTTAPTSKHAPAGTADRLWHIADTPDWQQAKAAGSYRCASLETEGFIHCCLDTQLAGVVQRYYAGRSDMIFLMLAQSALPAPVIMENTVGGEELFPHYYAVIPLTAILQALTLHDPEVQALLPTTGDTPC